MNKYVKVDSIELLKSGNQFFDVLTSVIREAKSSIHFQTYIFANDTTGKRIAHELKEAAQRGVKVWLLLDGYGSKELPTDFIQDLRNAGIQLRFFGSVFSEENVSPLRRLHHKIVTIDENQLMVGGINIGDKYCGTPTEKPWLDYAVLMKGNVIKRIHQLCEYFYAKKRSVYKVLNKGPFLTTGEKLVRFSCNDWVRRKNEIYRNYKAAIRKSTSTITIVGCYFLPGVLFLRTLKNASRRGVKIKILLGAQSDIPFFHHAEMYLYDYLLRYNIEIYEWTDSVLHGKAAVIDGKWSTIGSYNLNNLSRYKSIEFNVDIKDEKFSQQFQAELEEILNHKSKRITKENFAKKNHLFKKLWNFLVYSFYRTFMALVSSKD